MLIFNSWRKKNHVLNQKDVPYYSCNSFSIYLLTLSYLWISAKENEIVTSSLSHTICRESLDWNQMSYWCSRNSMQLGGNSIKGVTYLLQDEEGNLTKNNRDKANDTETTLYMEWEEQCRQSRFHSICNSTMSRKF